MLIKRGKRSELSDRIYHMIRTNDAPPQIPKYKKKPSEIAYLAGVIDSDGCIMIVRRKETGYAAQITMIQITPHACALAYELYGGCLQIVHQKIKDYPQQIGWTIGGQSTIKLLGDLIPFLRNKKEQGILALHLELMRDSIRQEGAHGRRRRRMRDYTEQELATFERFFVQCRELKHARPNYVIQLSHVAKKLRNILPNGDIKIDGRKILLALNQSIETSYNLHKKSSSP